MPTFEQTISLATMAHECQKDRAGQPYILHLLRVMLSMESEDERIVALLHDIVEDTEITFTTFEKLADYGFSSEVIKAVKHLTKQPGEEYIDYIQRVTKNPLAAKVKLADMRDNMDETRIPHPTDADKKLWQKYKAAYPILIASQRKEDTGADG